MLKKIEHQSLGTAYHTWVQSTFHFAVADYYKPLRQRFGIIRAINDDLVQPNSGHDMHVHRFVNLFTYVVSGELVHTVKGNTSDVLKEGDAYYLQSGSQCEHSELNWSSTTLRMLQIWISPNLNAKDIRYHVLKDVGRTSHNQFKHVIGHLNHEARLTVDVDLNLYVGQFEAITTTRFEAKVSRQVYVIQVSGESLINGISLSRYDSLEVLDESLVIQAQPTSKIVILDVKN